MTTVEEVEGEAGDFRVTLKTAPRYIDADKCTAEKSRMSRLINLLSEKRSPGSARTGL
ncbi:MAG: hypothetical protein K9J85_03225 [Desulfobacteraceae bacterium]|nr:hypothetical protein [Desulfobacteraceae bacterium]